MRTILNRVKHRYLCGWMFMRHGLCLARGILRDNADCVHSVAWICIDMLNCLILYGLSVNNYVIHKVWKLSAGEKRVFVSNLMQKKFKAREVFSDSFSDRAFVAKWSALKYDSSPRRIMKKIKRYSKRFHIGPGAWIEHGVLIHHEYTTGGSIEMGSDVLLSYGVDIDYTGGLKIGDNVKLMEGVKILTHAHDALRMKSNDKLIPGTNRIYYTPLKICDNVQIASRAMILPGVGEIGEGAMISAGSVVTRKVPPRVMVAGNPAKIVTEIPEDVDFTADTWI